MQKPTAVILSGQTAGLGVIRALGSQDVPIHLVYSDDREVGRKSRYVQKAFPAADPATQEKQFVEQLLETRIGHVGAILMPTSDATLSVASRYKTALEEKYIVACPDWPITEIFLDKKNTCAVAESAGVPAPKTLLPRCIEDIEAWSFDIQYPCLAKPSQSHRFRQHFNRKMFLANNLDELILAFRALEGTDVEMMVQEYIPGGDEMGANYNAYYLDGKPLVEFTAQKIRNAPPVTGSPCALVSELIEEVLEPGRRLLGAVNFSGFACTEFKRDPRDGVYKLMEVNVRHNLSSALAVGCGMNFPILQYRHLVDGSVPDPQAYQLGVYWVDITRDVRYWVFGPKITPFSLKKFLGPYLKKHVFAIFDLKDLGPAILRFAVTMTSLFSRSMGE
jgi:predicted ATP-grasp superfamily ATP-dependent carboligase